MPRESPTANVPGTPGSRRQFSELETRVLGAWYRAHEFSHAPTQMSILAISEDVQTIAGLVRQEVFKYEFGRDTVKAELAQIERFDEANSLESSIVEMMLGLPIAISGLGALSAAASIAVEALMSIAIDQAVGYAYGGVSHQTSVARAVAASFADTSVLTSTSFDGLLRVMDALHMAHVRSNEHQQTRMLNDLRVHIFSRSQPLDKDPALAERATTLLAAILDDRVRSELTSLQAKVHASLIDIRNAVRDRAFKDYERIWLIALARSPALRVMMMPRNPTGAIVMRLRKARVAELRTVVYKTETRWRYREAPGGRLSNERVADEIPLRRSELMPLTGYPEFAAEHYQVVFGVVPVK